MRDPTHLPFPTLCSTHASLEQDLRELLLTRMAASDPGRLGNAMMAHVLDSWGEASAAGGGEMPAHASRLAAAWLDALFVECCSKRALKLARPQAQSPTGPSTGAGAGAGAAGEVSGADAMEWEDGKTVKDEAADEKDCKPQLPSFGNVADVKKDDGDGATTEGPSYEEGASGDGGVVGTAGTAGTAAPHSSGGSGATLATSPSDETDLGTALEGSTYETVLIALLEGLRGAGHLTSALTLLPIAPALPRASVCRYLQVC